MKYNRQGIGTTTGKKWLWKLEIADGDLTFSVGPEEMEEFQLQDGNEPQGIWRGHSKAGANFVVMVRWRQMSPDAYAGTLFYQGLKRKLWVKNIHFPVIEMRYPKEGLHLLTGIGQGWIYNYPADTPDGIINELQPMALQFSAALNACENGGVYCDFRDTSYRLKRFCWERRGERLVYSGKILQPVPRHGGRSNGKLGFECVVADYVGGWYEATQIYRQWAVNTPNYKRRVRKNPMRNIGAWLWNRGPGDYVSDPAIQFAHDAGIPVALDWYWWHKCPYDTDYPDFWPPREGAKKFKSVLKKLAKAGIYTQVYLNGLAWDIDSKGFADGGAKSVIVTHEGTPFSVEFNKYTHHRLGYMCGEATRFQERLSGVIRHLVEAGLPGVYLDMIGCACINPCYNPAHRHLLGGGNYHVAGYRKFIKALRKEYPQTVFSTECGSDAFLDCFESVIILSASSERLGNSELVDCVPAFSAVFHGATAMFGNYALIDGIPPWDPLWPDKDRWKNEEPWEEVYPDQFCCELARTVIWGMQPTVCKLTMEQTDPDGRYAQLYQFLVKICSFYYQNREYLYDGRMLPPGELKCNTVDVAFMQRSLFTTNGNGWRLVRKMPAILHSVWESPDGHKALFVINYTRQEQCFSWNGIIGTLASRTMEIRKI